MQRKISYMVVSYFNSTSNHNSSHIHRTNRRVVSYFNSTSNHNNRKKDMLRDWLFLISILHQTTTIARVRISMKSLFLISILHQTTTKWAASLFSDGCFLFQFYIKPQHIPEANGFTLCCFLFQFYIKPQPRICDLLIVIRLYGRMNGTNGA